MKKTYTNLIFSLLYTGSSFYIATTSQAYIPLGVGAIIGLVACVLFLQTKEGKKLLKQHFFAGLHPVEDTEQVEKMQDMLEEIENEGEALRTKEKEIEVKIPFKEKTMKKKLSLPSLITSIYLIIATLLIILDQNNMIFTGFLSFAAITFWFQTWLYWKGEM